MINWDRVAELRTDMGEDDFDEVVELFLSEMDEKLEDLRVSGAPPGPDDLHFLRGSSANLGFRELMTLCLSAEKGERTLDVATISECYTASKAEFIKRDISGASSMQV